MTDTLLELEILKEHHPNLRNPKLRKVCKPITVFDDSLRALVSSMAETMIARDGAGLAAPQIGENIRLFVFREDESTRYTVAINPVILKNDGAVATQKEGCLSIPGLVGDVERFTNILVEFQDIDGNKVVGGLGDFTARCFQHELDHLNGVLYRDKAKAMYRLKAKG